MQIWDPRCRFPNKTAAPPSLHRPSAKYTSHLIIYNASVRDWSPNATLPAPPFPPVPLLHPALNQLRFLVRVLQSRTVTRTFSDDGGETMSAELKIQLRSLREKPNTRDFPSSSAHALSLRLSRSALRLMLLSSCCS